MSYLCFYNGLNGNDQSSSTLHYYYVQFFGEFTIFVIENL